MLITDAMAQETPSQMTAETGMPADAEAAPYDLSIDKMFMDTVVFLALLFGIFYFLLIRPQQKRLRQHNDMLATVKKGSRVVTGGGIIGTVSKQDGDKILVIEIAPDTKVKVLRSSVSEVLDETGPIGSTANDN